MRNFITLLNLIKFIHISEKSILILKKNYYTFIVDQSLTKDEIKYFFNIFLNLKIKKLNILNLKNNTKKIYIQFQTDHTLVQFFNLTNYLK